MGMAYMMICYMGIIIICYYNITYNYEYVVTIWLL